MSVFSTWFQGEMDAKGWDQRAAAAAVGVRETTMHNWLHKNARPSSKSLFRIALATKKPITTVARAAGYDDYEDVVTEEEAATARQKLLADLPQFADILDTMARKSPEEQAVYVALIRRVLLDPPDNSE